MFASHFFTFFETVDSLLFACFSRFFEIVDSLLFVFYLRFFKIRTQLCFHSMILLNLVLLRDSQKYSTSPHYWGALLLGPFASLDSYLHHVVNRKTLVSRDGRTTLGVGIFLITANVSFMASEFAKTDH